MKSIIKRIATLVLALTLVVPMLVSVNAYAATTKSETRTDINTLAGAQVKATPCPHLTYTGKKQTIAASKFNPLIGKATKVVSGGSGTNAGKYTAKVTINADATAKYYGTRTITTYWYIDKASNSISGTSASASVKYNKSKFQSVSVGKATAKFGSVAAYTYSSSSKNVYYNAKTGKVGVKAGTKKGTYTITLKVAGTSNYAAATRKITVTVK